MSTQEPGRTPPALTSLPRIEDLPRAGDGYDADRVQEAFETFRRVASGLSQVISLVLEPWRGDRKRFEPLYKRRWVDNFNELVEQADWVVAVIHDLIFELTRAANLVCAIVRIRLDPLFLLDEGVLTVQRQGAGFYFDSFRPLYRPDELDEGVGYVGLREFIDSRGSLDIHFGEGMHEQGWTAISLPSLPAG